MTFRTAAASRPHDEAKPRVLLADDFAPIAERAVALLAPDFDVVATVADGRRALDACTELDPDVAVLDIGMPGLDGFQVARALRESGSRARIVFLTMHRSDDFVTAALLAGADGYVHKPRLDDLPATLDHVIAGRRFSPSLAALAATAGDGGGDYGHVLTLYKDPRERIDGWCAVAHAAFERGDIVSIVAPQDIVNDISEALDAIGCDTAGAAREGRYVMADAVATLSDVAPSTGVDAARVASIVGQIEQARLAFPGGPAPRVTILGELSGTLGRLGRYQDALRLEQLWHSDTRVLPFFTACSYSAECFDRDTAFYAHLCAAHGAVSHEESVR